ncbi:MAG TPA: polysaccharide deacetylase family protein [Candidatus Eremiobacteraceae bacterium]|nr:polysaccharide deacetylase family protein [Candidatus Eremiobacteraceae bacterium]
MARFGRFFIFVLILAPLASAQTRPDRRVAITMDDLPASAAQSMSALELTDMTTRIVATFKEQQIPAVGFVNENKLYLKVGEVDARIATLNQWLDAGLELGNHAFSHPSFNKIGLKEFEESVIRGETVTKTLLAQHGKKMRYFRHPFLDVGRDLQSRRELESFLANRGYTIAPVTLDPEDWAFAPLYDAAKKSGDAALQKKIADAYLSFADAVFEYDEKFSMDLFGYELPQVILLHGNNLEADHLADLLNVLRKRGYRFVSLESALNDFAYSSPNTFVGEHGGSWLEQWAVSRGRALPPGEPLFPEEMQKLRKASPPPLANAPVPPVL